MAAAGRRGRRVHVYRLAKNASWHPRQLMNNMRSAKFRESITRAAGVSSNRHSGEAFLICEALARLEGRHGQIEEKEGNRILGLSGNG